VSAYTYVAAGNRMVDVFVDVSAGTDVVITDSTKHASKTPVKILIVFVIKVHLIKQTKRAGNTV